MRRSTSEMLKEKTNNFKYLKLLVVCECYISFKYPNATSEIPNFFKQKNPIIFLYLIINYINKS